MKTIIVTVSPEGRPSIETRGFVGPECRDASRFLEEALGARTTEQLSAEFYEQRPTSRNVQQSN